MNRLLLLLLVGFLSACSSPVSPQQSTTSSATSSTTPPPNVLTVSGTVTDSASMQLLAGAKVEWQDAMADAPSWSGVQTDSSGAYQLTVRKIPAIEFHVSKSGYVDQDLVISVREDMREDFALTPVTAASAQAMK